MFGKLPGNIFLYLMSKKVVLITSGQPSLNPRLVKEADALTGSGFQVTVIYQYWNVWGTKTDQLWLSSKKWSAIRIGGSPKQHKVVYWLSRFQHKTVKKLFKYFGFKHQLAERAAGRCTFLMLKEALRHPADLYIAHNLAALPIAVLAAKKHKAKCGFDAEDFHRNEVSDDPNHSDVRLKTYLEEKYIPQTDYLTASSLAITQLYQKLFPSKKIVTVLNAFPIEKEVQLPIVQLNQPLKLFWFSQTIGLNRGLQDVFSALKFLEDELIELHLLGFLDEQTSVKLNELIAGLQFQKKPFIFFHPPVNPDQLSIFAAKFDIGLALEPGFSINNNAALSNKIFTYLQAGLAVVATDTLAQKQFMAENPQLGFCYEKGNAQQLSEILKHLLNAPELLLKTKQEAYISARSNLNWETESLKFLKVVEETLAD